MAFEKPKKNLVDVLALSRHHRDIKTAMSWVTLVLRHWLVVAEF